MSGGRATVMLKTGRAAANQAGDISSIDQLAHTLIDNFVIECKFYRSLELHNLIFDGQSGILSFWNQVSTDAEQNSKLPLLIAKQNRYPVIMGLSTQGVAHLLPQTSPSVIAPEKELYIYLFEEFLQATPWEI